jgi:hypothetical protein
MRGLAADGSPRAYSPRVENSTARAMPRLAAVLMRFFIEGNMCSGGYGRRRTEKIARVRHRRPPDQPTI